MDNVFIIDSFVGWKARFEVVLLRSTRYTDVEGISHTSFEVIANEVTLL